MSTGDPIYVRLPLDVQLRLEQLAAEAGYTRSLVFRKLLDGALKRLDLGESRRDLVIALNQWSRVK